MNNHDRDIAQPPPNEGGSRGGPGGGGQRGGGPEGGGRRGPPNSDFLDLEMSKIMYEESRRLAKEAGQELMREAIKARLRERLGDQIEALARIAADELADDILANLEIEARIDERRRKSSDLASRVAEALRKK